MDKIKELMKKLMSKAVDIWNCHLPVKFGPYLVLNFFAGSGVGFWIFWLIGKFYCLIAHKEMATVFNDKAK